MRKNIHKSISFLFHFIFLYSFQTINAYKTTPKTIKKIHANICCSILTGRRSIFCKEETSNRVKIKSTTTMINMIFLAFLYNI